MTTQTHTVVSYNRPLTRDAERALESYGIVEKEATNDFGKWTVVETEERPDDSTLEKHELRLDRDPMAEYNADNGDMVLIYDDTVIVDGVEAGIEPEEAIEHAENAGWERVDE